MNHSIQALLGADLKAADGKIGRCLDFLFDDAHWTVRYLVVDTRHWLPGRKVLISPAWAGAIDWKRSRLHVRVDRRAIEASPEYDRERDLTRADELALFEHYDFKPYWLDVP